MYDLSLSTLIEERNLHDRIEQIGEELTKRFKGESIVAVCILKGSFMFFADLVRKIDLDLTCDFMGVSSYVGTKSTGAVKLTLDLSNSVKGKHVLLIEDIVDTGYTMKFLKEVLEDKEPKSITTIALLHKPEALKVECPIDTVGFEIGNEFVVGYGLDYQGYYRHLPYIARVTNLN